MKLLKYEVWGTIKNTIEYDESSSKPTTNIEITVSVGIVWDIAHIFNEITSPVKNSL